jgi:hypothetical protein
MRLTLFCLTIFAGLISCKKDKLDLISFWQCNKSLNLDTTAISNKLVGSWTLSKQKCGDFGETKKASKNIKVTFQNDYSFSVKENSITESQGTWKLKRVDADTWVLDLSLTSEYLYGDILFCDNLLLLNDNHRDGCANLFKRNN